MSLNSEDYEKIVSVALLRYYSEKNKSYLNSKVDKVEGKGLSTNDLTNELITKYNNAADSSHTHSNKNIIDNTTASFTIDLKNKLDGVDTSKYADSLDLSIDTSTYVMSISLKNGNTAISTKTIDFPIESMVVGATYNPLSKKLELTLQNGTKTECDISDIVSGLVPDTRNIAGIDLKDDITVSELQTALELDNKVDKVSGKGLSTNDYTTEEKTKLSEIATNANNYTHPHYTSKSNGLYKVTVDKTGHVSSATAVTKSDITALGIPSTNTTYSNATTTTSGLMSATDKTKLDGIDISNKITAPQTASVGQVLIVKSVDSSGQPTDWECSDIIGDINSILEAI